MSRSYEQRCFIARALDVLGERWTLLIVRELTLGPRRYGELLAALQGLGTSLLASRLKSLEEHGVIRRTAPGGAGHAYELAERGEALIPLLGSLAEWGAGLGQSPPEYADMAAWRLVAMRLTAPAEAAQFRTLTQLVVDDEQFWVHGDGEKVRTQIGLAPVTPGLRMSCDRATFTALARGRTTVGRAVAAGRLALDGDPEDAGLFFRLFTLPGLDAQLSS